MSEFIRIAKVICTVGFILAATAALYFDRSLALPLFVGAIAWSKIPE